MNVPDGTESRPLVVLEAVGRRYGEGPTAVDALKNVNLEVQPGEFVVILGPSGSGKTTLLNLIGGIDSPTAGRVVVSGQDIGTFNLDRRVAYRRDHIGFVFQFFNLIPTLTALENVALIAELTGKDEEASAEALRQVGLTEQLDRFPGALSGGEQQRVAIARSLVKNPQLILADEPTGNIDTQATEEIIALLQRLNRE
ncbi:MAG: ABC transporter ATP-binding protein, partial [Chloroflexi bacterium]|nr:ABC transporter ATP-binding protein [Chloroflexota bacterium]